MGMISPQGTFTVDDTIWEKLYDSTLSSDASSVTISGLDGDSDKAYKLYVHFAGGSTYQEWCFLRINGDSSVTYYTHQLYGNGSSVLSRILSNSFIYLCGIGVNNFEGNCEVTIMPKTGDVRVVNALCSNDLDSTSISNTFLTQAVYPNTSTNITSLLIDSQSGSIYTGTKIILWRL